MKSSPSRAASRVAVVGIAVTLSIGMSACSVAPEIGDTYAATTPSVYTENRVYYVGSPLTEKKQAEDADPSVYRPLLHPYEIKAAVAPEGSRRRSREDFNESLTRDRLFKKNDPLGVIVRGVRIPEDLGERKDIAVVLDLLTKGSDKVQSLVVFYQRDVPGGQMLNFANLLVYYDPQWDGVSAPYFRLRVLDVKAERNRQTRQVLDDASSLAGIVSGISPHPLIPVVAKAIQAAGLILGNRSNTVLIDYSVQFYSEQQRTGAGGADIGLLCTGEFLAMGRPAGGDSSFWQKPMLLDRRSLQIVERTSPRREVWAPYFSLVVVKAKSQVPSIVMDRSKALVDLLSTPSGKGDLDQLETVARSLSSSAQAYVAEQRLLKYESIPDMGVIVKLLSDNDTALASKKPALLNTDEVARLVFVISQIAESEHFTDVGSIVSWWNDTGKRGHFEESKENQFGFKWVKAP